MSNSGPHKEIFGQTDEGKSVYRMQLKGGGLTANIITWGAVLQDLRLEGHEPPLVLGFDDFASYPTHSPYFGSTPGRFANRLGNARFEIDGVTHNTDPNFMGKHTLHGGTKGTDKRIWEIADLGTSHVVLTLTDHDGEMGFPGTCQHTCSYTLKENGTLHISFTTRTDAPTIANLAHHSYFNLDGSAECLEHEMQVFADQYLPVDDEMIPTGEIASVDNTPFDFRTSKRIEADITGTDFFYDHNFCTSKTRQGLREVASVYSPKSRVKMTIASTEPGLQFYAGHKVKTPVNGLTGRLYDAYAGFCLETQNWPDAPNHPEFPNAILRPDEELRQTTEYKFVKN